MRNTVAVIADTIRRTGAITRGIMAIIVALSVIIMQGRAHACIIHGPAIIARRITVMQ